MPKIFKYNGVIRIIDANINRVKEGLRVCEEVARFILDNRNLTAEFKKIRHKIDTLIRQMPGPAGLLKERRSSSDVGRNIYINELKRRDFQDIFSANIQRVKESVRVLEEFSKLKNTAIAIEFKKIRYKIYEIEKKAIDKITALRRYR